MPYAAGVYHTIDSGGDKEGLCDMEVVEVSPPYDHAEITALLGGRIVCYVLAILVRAAQLAR